MLSPAVFFDVDDTLITWDHRERPFMREVVSETARMGCEVYIWSGLGPRWEIVDVFDLRPYVVDCFAKPLSRHRERLSGMGILRLPDHVVDDDAEIVAVFGGTHVPAPLEPLEDDRHLLAVLDDLRRRFRPCQGDARS